MCSGADLGVRQCDHCSDGVDGLSGTLSIVTLITIYLIDRIKDRAGDFSYVILLLCVCILGYLWYNATPSKLMMGDAGSRAMGLFISIAILKTGCPFLYIPVAIMLILDGGLGLVKVALLRFCKIHILKNTRTPLPRSCAKGMGLVQYPDCDPLCHNSDRGICGSPGGCAGRNVGFLQRGCIL